MAEKIIKVRTEQKIDTTENWNNSTLVLKEGELAIDKNTSELRFGDGNHTFKDSPIVNDKQPRSADIVIAAYDSSDEWKAGADYVCDGKDDQVEINAAIERLSSGGKILLSSGTFYITGSINISSRYFVLQGMGDGTKICTAQTLGTNAGIFDIDSAMRSICKIKDLCLCNNSDLAGYVVNAFAKNLEIENVNLTSSYAVPSSLGYTAKSYSYANNPGSLVNVPFSDATGATSYDHGIRVINCRIDSDYSLNWKIENRIIIDKLYLRRGIISFEASVSVVNILHDTPYTLNYVTINVIGSGNKIYQNPYVTINDSGTNNIIS